MEWNCESEFFIGHAQYEEALFPLRQELTLWVLMIGVPVPTIVISLRDDNNGMYLVRRV